MALKESYGAFIPSFNRSAWRCFFPASTARRDLDLLIRRSPACCANPDAALVIAGDGDAALTESLRRSCRSLGIEKSVYWPGFLSGPAKAAALADADVFVLPSYSENFGIAVIEAMALGVPVIVTDQVGVAAKWRPATQVSSRGLKWARFRARSYACSTMMPPGRDLGRNGAALAHSQFRRPSC